MLIKKWFTLGVLSCCVLSCGLTNAWAQKLPLHRIKLPEGFKISLYASDVTNARSMARSPNGTLFVGSRQAGQVYALVDQDGDYKIDQQYIIAQGLNMPNGVAIKDGSLYVAEVNRVLRFDNIEANLKNPPKPVIVNDSFPTDRHHGWKFIRFGPDEKLYVPVGAPCNICLRDDERYSSIMRMNKDGSELEVFANGVRNSVGFDWNPQTNVLWFTDNGRDQMGNDIPPDELNRAPVKGMHFGYPFCHGPDVSDPIYGEQRPCSDFTPPAQPLGPHVASLGMRFNTHEVWPAQYHNQIFIAEHGSWNRSRKIGYRIMLVTVEGDRAVSYKVFAEGWMKAEKVWGRPVDIEFLPDGSMLVSDDYANAIYRITYTKK